MIKFIHLGDLHLGIKFHKRELLMDQEFVLRQVLEIMRKEEANLIIAGDIFHTVNPSLSAQRLWYEFIHHLAEINRECDTQAFIIPGNHDSAIRLGLGSEFLESSNIYITTQDPAQNHYYDVRVVMNYSARYPNVRVVSLPYIKPAITSEAEFKDHNEAVRWVLHESKPAKWYDTDLLICHQTFEGGRLGESEFKPFMPDAVSADVVSDFGIVLAGHLHGYQKVGKNIYYSGSLLPYAFGDDYHQSISMVTLKEDKWCVDRLPIKLLHKLSIVTGNLDACLKADCVDDYVKVKLVNEPMSLGEVLPQLEAKFPYLCCVVTQQSEVWEVDLTKEVGTFHSIGEAINAFCDHLEVPRIKEDNPVIKEVLDAYPESQNS